MIPPTRARVSALSASAAATIAALDQLRRDSHDVHDDDVRRLSPLGHDHINLLGRYQFSATNLTHGRLTAASRSHRTRHLTKRSSA